MDTKVDSHSHMAIAIASSSSSSSHRGGFYGLPRGGGGDEQCVYMHACLCECMKGVRVWR